MTAPKSRRFLDIAIDKLGDKYGDPMRIRRAMASALLAKPATSPRRFLHRAAVSFYSGNQV